jgi:uncharacterized membrane protein
VPGAERSPQWWLLRGVTLVLWSVAAAGLAAYTGEERFTARLVLIFAGIILLIHVVIFVAGQVRDRFRSR